MGSVRQRLERELYDQQYSAATVAVPDPRIVREEAERTEQERLARLKANADRIAGEWAAYYAKGQAEARIGAVKGRVPQSTWRYIESRLQYYTPEQIADGTAYELAFQELQD